MSTIANLLTSFSYMVPYTPPPLPASLSWPPLCLPHCHGPPPACLTVMAPPLPASLS